MREMGDTLRERLGINCGIYGRYIMGKTELTLWGRNDVDECFNHVTF